METVFSTFLLFIEKVNKNVKEWIEVKNNIGDDTVMKLISWVYKFQHFKATFFNYVKLLPKFGPNYLNFRIGIQRNAKRFYSRIHMIIISIKKRFVELSSGL